MFIKLFIFLSIFFAPTQSSIFDFNRHQLPAKSMRLHFFIHYCVQDLSFFCPSLVLPEFHAILYKSGIPVSGNTTGFNFHLISPVDSYIFSPNLIIIDLFLQVNLNTPFKSANNTHVQSTIYYRMGGEGDV